MTRRCRGTALTIAVALLPLVVAADDSQVTIRAEVWGDNWYAVYVGDQLVGEDSTPYDTERSFNSDTFVFDAKLPAQLNVVMKDYKENDSGLEYIGSGRQQIGDGGFAAQFFNNETNKLIAHSDSDWRCLVIHRAPLNRQCVHSDDPTAECTSEIRDEPTGWMQPDFDDSEWQYAIVHSAQDVRPRGGYQSIDWHADAKLIWSADLEIDNTVLCRTEIGK